VTKPGTATKALVSNLDFGETFLDVAGVPVPADMQGRSFKPLLRGETPADWRTAFYYQYFEYPTPHRVRPHYGVITDRYKLVHFEGMGEAYWELFDREKDPSELKSVYGEAAYAATIAELKKELTRLRQELKVPAEIPARFYGNQGAGGEGGKRKKQAKQSDL
jgi:arylsulfatase A-like enzyme